MDSSIDWSLSIVPRLQSGYTECGIWAQLSESSAQRGSNNQTSTTEESVLLYSCPKTASPKSVCHWVEIIPNSYPNRNLVKRHLIFSFLSRTIPIPPQPCHNPCPGFYLSLPLCQFILLFVCLPGFKSIYDLISRR